MTPPHIIIIMTDQHRWDATGFSHCSWVETPHLDALASGGIDFRSCYCAAPSCVPSRASFFTCTYPHQNGVYHNGCAWAPTWVAQLRSAGYHTVNVGKMHTIPLDSPAGFDQRYVVENKDRTAARDRPHGVYLDEWQKYLKNSGVTRPTREAYRDNHPLYETALGAYEWELAERYHPDVFTAAMAEWFLDDRDPKNPLFLQIGFPGPHPPYDPPRRYLDRYENAEFALPHPDPSEYERQPPPHRRYRQEMVEGNHDAVRWHDAPTKDSLRRLRQHYAANVALIDDQVGRIMSALGRNGYLDNCVVLFTSDHGDCLGDHGHIQKWTMYEEIVHVPALLWGPSVIRTNRPMEGLIQQMDLVPILFELAGIPFEAPEAIGRGGVDAAEILSGDSQGRDHVFAEHGRCRMLPDIETMRMVRDNRWKLVDYPGFAFGELYDLESDPRESTNLWNDASHTDQRAHLERILSGWSAGKSV